MLSTKPSINKIEEIGNGGFGTAYKIYTNDDEIIVSKENKIDIDDFLTYTNLNEINNYKLLEDCENIINFKGFHVDENNVNIYLEYMDYDLHKWVENTDYNTRLDNFNSFFEQIYAGLYNLLNLKMTHNDLKPKNILVKGNDTFKLCDLGVSGFKKWVIEYSHLGGTIDCRSPESLFKRSPEYCFTKIDLWSFGLCCIYYLTGKYIYNDSELEYLKYKIYRSTQTTLTYEKFGENIINGKIRGSLNVKKIFKDLGFPRIPESIINKIIYLLKLNPKERTVIADIPKTLKCDLPKEYKINDTFYRLVLNFGMDITEIIISIDVLYRYINITKIKNVDIDVVLPIILLVRKYYSDKIISDGYAHMLNTTEKELNNKIYDILKTIDYKIYNPNINLNIDTEVYNYLYCNMYTFKDSKIDWFFNKNYDKLKEWYIDYFIKNNKKMKLTLDIKIMIEMANFLIKIYNDHGMKNNRIIYFSIFLFSQYCSDKNNIILEENLRLIMLSCLLYTCLIIELDKPTIGYYEIICEDNELNKDKFSNIFIDVCKFAKENNLYHSLIPYDLLRFYSDDYYEINKYLMLLCLCNKKMVNNVKSFDFFIKIYECGYKIYFNEKINNNDIYETINKVKEESPNSIMDKYKFINIQNIVN